MRGGFWRSERGCRELEELATRFPSLHFELHDDGSAFLRGRFDVASDVGYTVELEIPRRYPHDIPVLHCDPTEIPWELDRHVITNIGHGCLCARSEDPITLAGQVQS